MTFKEWLEINPCPAELVEIWNAGIKIMEDLIEKLNAGVVNAEKDSYNYDDFYNINIDATNALMKEAASKIEELEKNNESLVTALMQIISNITPEGKGQILLFNNAKSELKKYRIEL